MEHILVTGGAGYIGSHMCVALLKAGYRVVVLDNLSNGHAEALTRVEELTGIGVAFVRGDLADRKCVDGIFREYRISAVMHFAGLKAVGESWHVPLEYWRNNVAGTLALLQSMSDHGVHTIVFSSSATVYGNPAQVPVREDFPLSATNPYGLSKLHVEDMLRQLRASDQRWSVALLRYFNPVGAHESGRLGESPHGTPNNLMPFVAQVAAGVRPCLDVFGDDWPTPDGTGVRDYIHVMDLVEGHLAALRRLAESGGLVTVNLGTGQGYSVLQMVQAFERVSGRDVPWRVVSRRAGDVAQCYADPALAHRELEWRARRSLEQMCEDHWRWQRDNPSGYGA